MNRKKETLSTLLVLIGTAALILSIVCFFALETGDTSNREVYGGDAYTGIQNAGAKTANNLVATNTILKAGFSSILLISGLVLLVTGACMEHNAPVVAPVVIEKEIENAPESIPEL